MSATEYLSWERQQPTKHEFFHGEVFAMAGGSLRHNALCGRVITSFSVALDRSSCVVLTSDQRVGMGAGGRYVYPDVTVVCGPVVPEPGTADVLANPMIIVEVLSSTTEQYDRGLKWDGYQRIASLTDYVLVSQLEPKIEHFRRERDGSWIYRSASGGELITLSNGVPLRVDELFEGIMQLPATEPAI
jgi:Uma2 family endonuclease